MYPSYDPQLYFKQLYAHLKRCERDITGLTAIISGCWDIFFSFWHSHATNSIQEPYVACIIRKGNKISKNPSQNVLYKQKSSQLIQFIVCKWQIAVTICFCSRHSWNANDLILARQLLICLLNLKRSTWRKVSTPWEQMAEVR